ncbi:MAG: hypothetical protein JOZ17_02485, partial [Acetobacteraceae bacterium]|nr:hypothetical protein [Acetobacteraceae bacterium]
MSSTVPSAFSLTKATSMSRIRVHVGVLIRAVAILFYTLAHPATSANAQADWPTFAFDMQRTGFNPRESILGPQTVSNLHLLWSVDLGGPVTAQATLLSNVETSAGAKAIVYVSTLLGDVFALNAADGAVVWHRSLGFVLTPCSDFSASGYRIGVIGTPSIDRSRKCPFRRIWRRKIARSRYPDWRG